MVLSRNDVVTSGLYFRFWEEASRFSSTNMTSGLYFCSFKFGLKKSEGFSIILAFWEFNIMNRCCILANAFICRFNHLWLSLLNLLNGGLQSYIQHVAKHIYECSQTQNFELTWASWTQSLWLLWPAVSPAPQNDFYILLNSVSGVLFLYLYLEEILAHISFLLMP